MNVSAAKNDLQIPKVASEVSESSDMIKPTWVAPGKKVQYPNEGGTWEYGYGRSRLVHTIQLINARAVLL